MIFWRECFLFMLLFNNIHITKAVDASSALLLELVRCFYIPAKVNEKLGTFTALIPNNSIGRKIAVLNVCLFPAVLSSIGIFINPKAIPVTYFLNMIQFLDGFNAKNKESLTEGVQRLISYATIDYRLARLPKNVEKITEKNAVSTFISTYHLYDESELYEMNDRHGWKLISLLHQYKYSVDRGWMHLFSEINSQLNLSEKYKGKWLNYYGRIAMRCIADDSCAQELIKKQILMERIFGNDIAQNYVRTYFMDEALLREVQQNRRFIRGPNGVSHLICGQFSLD